MPGRPLGEKSDKCRDVGGREGHVNVSTFVFAKERLLWTGIVTDSICVLIFLCRVGCVWLLVFAFVCRLDGGMIGLDGMGAMAGCEYSVHDMTLRRCDARPSVGGCWCLVDRWVGSRACGGGGNNYS